MGESVLQEEISITLQVAWLVTFAQYILKHDNGELYISSPFKLTVLYIYI